jgi:hypothetical protein
MLSLKARSSEPSKQHSTLRNSNEPAANDGQPTLSTQSCLIIDYHEQYDKQIDG